MYVVKLNNTFIMIDMYLLFDFDKQVCHHVLDPNSASEFKTKKEAKEVVETNIDEDDYEIVKKSTAISDFDTWVDHGMIFGNRNLIDHNINQPYDPDKHDIHDVFKFFINHYEREDSISFDVYTTWPSIMKGDIAHHIWGVEAYHNPDNYDDLRYSVKISVDSNDEDVKLFEDEINLALEYCTEDTGVKKLSVIDHKCGAGGDFVYITTNDNGKSFDVNGRFRAIKKNLNIEQLFKYLKTERPYEHV